jgi:hypothetical protein
MNRWWSYSAFAILSAPLSVTAQEFPTLDDSPLIACQVLKDRMAKVMRLPGGRPDSSWFCEDTSIQNNYLYVIQLRSKPAASTGTPNVAPLIGTFAVARRSTVVLQVDVAGDRLIPISSSYSLSQ